MKHNRIIALILMAFIMTWAYFTTRLPESTMTGEPGPKFFPSTILLLMAIFTVILFFIKDKNKKADNIKSDDAEKEVEVKKPFPMLSAIKLYAVFLGGIILIYFLGFNIGMILALTAMLWMIGWKIFPRALLFSSAVTLAIYFLFDWLMKIPLPTGKLF